MESFSVHGVWSVVRRGFLFCAVAVLLGCGDAAEEETSTTAAPSDRMTQAMDAGEARVRAVEDPLLEMAEPRRRFRLVYEATIQQIPKGNLARVWIPIAQSTSHQWVQVTKIDVPAKYDQNTETQYGNRLLYFETQPNSQGEIQVSIEYEVTRFEILPSNYETASPDERALFLQPNRLVPNDESLREKFFQGVGVDELASLTARQIYDRVRDQLEYRKPPGEPWGRGDAAWACESRFGNCTDFHSLFISLCRTSNIPARFEMGFALPDSSGAISGYHCWAFFSQNDRWVPVDVSDADRYPEQAESLFGWLPANRVMLTRGRDLMLSPLQDAGPINFLIDPYVEVAGSVHDESKAAYQVEYLDADPDTTAESEAAESLSKPSSQGSGLK